MVTEGATAASDTAGAMNALVTILRARPAASAMAPPRPVLVRPSREPDLTEWEDIVDLLENAGPGTFGDGIPTGLTDLDRLTGGLAAGQLVIVGGPDPDGTSSFVLGLLRACAVRHGLPALLFAPGTGRSHVGRLIAAAEAGLDARRMRAGAPGARDLEQLAECLPALTAAPLMVDDRTGLTVDEVRAHARLLVRREGVRLVVVDRSHLLAGGDPERLPRELKLTARELGVPVVVVAPPAGSGGAVRPGPGDPLTLPADHADLVLLLDHDAGGQAHVRVTKNRNGPPATLVVTYEARHARFADAPAPYGPAARGA